MRTKEQSLQREIEGIKRKLLALGEMRPGSLSMQTRKWGGEYWQLSYTHRGKGHTQYIGPKNRKAVERQIANYRKFRELTLKWVDAEIELCTLNLEEQAEA